jgi:hypothetical protein
MASLLLLAACLDTAGPQRTEDVSILEYQGNPSKIEIPDTIDVGARFDVNITTYGRGCDQQGNDYVSMPSDSMVRIQPTELFLLSGQSCNGSLQQFPHVVNLLASRAGRLEVRVDGLTFDGTTFETISSVGIVFVR